MGRQPFPSLEVEALIDNVAGEKLLSDQKIHQQAVAQALVVSQQWAEETQVKGAVEVAASAKWYDGEAQEALVLADAIQVKRQKAT